MIRRLLVPINVRPLTAEERAAKPRRLTTLLDERTVVPNNLPVTLIDTRTNIPTHLPLDVLAARVVVPRDTPAKLLDKAPEIPDYMPLSILDTRMVVPAGLEPGPVAAGERIPPELYADMVEPDVFTTGEVNLLTRPVDTRGADWNQISRFASLITHIVLIVFVILSPKIFPERKPTQEDLDLARRQLSFVYLPPSVDEIPKIAPTPQPPSSIMRVDPRVLRKLAPNLEFSPPPGPVTPETTPPQPELPSSPTFASVGTVRTL